MAEYKAVPTVRPVAGFNANEDAATLRAAMKGLGTDEDTIINIITSRSNELRQKISKVFEDEYGRNLIDDLKSELGGHFEDVIVALCIPSQDFLAKELNKAMSGLGTEEDTLVEIMCSQNSKEVKQIAESYERLYGRPLAEHLCSETSGDFRRLLTLIVTNTRGDNTTPNVEVANGIAQQLVDAGELKVGTDEEVFNKILTHESFAQLRQVFEEYKKISGRTIEQALQDEVSGDLLDGLLAIVECVQNPATYFAKRIYKALDGSGTDDRSLIRILVSRSEIDLGSIKSEYEKLYDKTMESDVMGDTSGDYRPALLGLLRTS